jgi:ribosome-associated protein
MQPFHISDEFIELNRLLKVLNLAESGGQANQFIADGLIQVNGVLELRKRKKLRPGDVVKFRKSEIQILNDEGE